MWIFKELKGTTFKEEKEHMRTTFHQIQNVNKEKLLKNN